MRTNMVRGIGSNNQATAHPSRNARNHGLSGTEIRYRTTKTEDLSVLPRRSSGLFPRAEAKPRNVPRTTATKDSLEQTIARMVIEPFLISDVLSQHIEGPMTRLIRHFEDRRSISGRAGQESAT